MANDFHGNITHIIYDLDGLLIDTETCYTTATNAITKRYDKQFSWHLKCKVMGLSPHEAAKTVIDQLELPLDVHQYLAEVDKQFSVAIEDIDLMPGAERLVKHLHTHDIPQAIATGSNKHSFGVKTNRFEHFFHKQNYFRHHVLAADDPHVKRGKPFPDVFLVCMERFESSNLKPEEILVFEDSPAGVEAAISAGMKCVMVPDPNVDHTQYNPTIVLKSLNDFRPEQFGLPAF